MTILKPDAVSEMMSKLVSGIYLIRNMINGKKYVGSTISTVGFDLRWSKHRSELNHRRHGNPHLQSAWNKYGENNFEFVILEECCDDVLVEREQKWITYYKSKSNRFGYNMRDAGNNGKHSEETKQKIRESKRGQNVGVNNPFYGMHHTEEAKSKNRDAHIGKLQTKETVKKRMKNLYGKNHWIHKISGGKLSEEHKRKISESQKGHKASLETRRKMSVSQKGRKVSLETRRKMSESWKFRRLKK